MDRIHWAMLRVRSITARRALERDMQEEMREHLERATERYAARGMSLAEARSAARREFGNVGALQEEARDIRGSRWAGDLAADVRFALRHFARHKVVAATVVSVLALGIGFNTAYFSMLQALLFRPAPAVPRNDAHVRIYALEQPSQGQRLRLRGFSYPELTALRERTRTFASVAAWMGHGVVLDPGDSAGARGVVAEFVTPNFFDVLGAPLAAGPGFIRQESGAPDLAAVMAFALAEELYGTAAAAVGRAVRVNDVALRIAGVAPPRFQGAVPLEDRPAEDAAELWIPLGARAEIAHASPRWLDDDGGPLALFAHLAPSVTPEQATSVAQQVVGRMLPDSAARVGMSRMAQVLPMRAPRPLSRDAGDYLGMVAPALIGLLVLLVACTNVSSLMVAAAVARRQEIAVRLSLGASRGRLIRQLLTESTLLALAGGAIGFLIYWWIVLGVFRRMREMQNYEWAPDLSTLAFVAAFALGTGILFGLSPALHATRGGVAGALRDSGAGATHRSRLQRGLVVAQIALSQPLLVLLAVTILVVWRGHTPMPRGVTAHVILAEFRTPDLAGAALPRTASVDSLRPRVAAHPGVVGVVPEARAFVVRSLAVETPADSAAVPPTVFLEGTAPGYFAMLDVPIVLGRDVSLADTAAMDIPVVVGSDLARAVWGDENPIGKTLPSLVRAGGSGQDSASMTVVGVYDAAHQTTRGSAVTRVYTAHGKRWRSHALLIRTRTAAEAVMPELRQLIRAEAPLLAVSSMRTLAHRDDETRRDALRFASVMGGAGALALLLASIGLYGVVSLAVRQRTREIGIRIAIGAAPGGVARMFLASGVRVSVVAMALGLPLSLMAMRVLLSQRSVQLPQVSLWLVGLAIAATLLLVASVATWLPARQAARVDPARTLRVE